MTRGTLDELGEWLQDQADGDWEHQHGVSIESLDNPGWSVRIDLKGTALEEKSFENFNQEEAGGWLRCWVDTKDCSFNAACGPSNLSSAIACFTAWVAEAEKA